MAPHRLLLLPLVFLALPGSLTGQDLLEQIRALAQENAEGYGAPLTSGLAYVLSDPHVDRSRPLSTLSFDVGIRFHGAVPSGDSKTFQVAPPDSVLFQHPSLGSRVYHDPFRSLDGSLETPTIAGEGEGLILVPAGDFETDLLAAGEDPDDYRLFLPDGLGLPVVPHMALHLSVGVGMGTDVSLRFTPALEVAPELGQLRAHGGNVSHLLTRWFSFPIDITASAGYQEATVTDRIRTTAAHLGLMGGASAGPMDFFAGAVLRDASTEVSYRLEVPEGAPILPGQGEELSFRSRASSTPGFLVGARLQLLMLNLTGHYTASDQNVFSLKVGMGIP